MKHNTIVRNEFSELPKLAMVKTKTISDFETTRTELIVSGFDENLLLDKMKKLLKLSDEVT